MRTTIDRQQQRRRDEEDNEEQDTVDDGGRHLRPSKSQMSLKQFFQLLVKPITTPCIGLLLLLILVITNLLKGIFDAQFIEQISTTMQKQIMTYLNVTAGRR